MGDSHPKGSYCLDDACKMLHLVIGKVASCLIWHCVRERASVHVFHFKPSRLTMVVLESSTLSFWACSVNMGLFDAQDWSWHHS